MLKKEHWKYMFVIKIVVSTSIYSMLVHINSLIMFDVFICRFTVWSEGSFIFKRNSATFVGISVTVLLTKKTTCHAPRTSL